MKRILTLIGLLALASCAPDEPPPVAKVPAKPAVAPKPPEPKPSGPKPPEPSPSPAKPVAPPAPLSEPPRPKPLEEPPAPVTPRPNRSRSTPGAQVYLPAFTFRGVDGEVIVQINGEVLSSTPCLWSIADAMEFDPKIRVDGWPPEGAVLIGSTSHPDKGSAEVYLDQQEGLSTRYPHLRKGEAILYVNGTVGGRAVRGALRLFVEGYKYVVYTPLVSPESAEASRFLRSIWLDRKSNE
jgi:hypothetical protein